MTLKSNADRGKSAEHQIKKVLDILATRADTAYYRLPDARAGSLKATLADFLMMHRGATFLLEVKEVDHPYRLPVKNFATDKRARMKRFKLAGALTYVLVLHTPLQKWRCAELEFFENPECASWDLRQFELHDLDEIIKPGETHKSVLLLPHEQTINPK